jgi:hypothetical protein
MFVIGFASIWVFPTRKLLLAIQNFQRIGKNKITFINRIIALVAGNKISSSDFIINWDQTACHLFPCDGYTYSDIKDKNSAMIGKDDKRVITAVTATAFNGEILPLHLIFGAPKPKKKKQEEEKKEENVKEKEEVEIISGYDSRWYGLCLEYNTRVTILQYGR